MISKFLNSNITFQIRNFFVRFSPSIIFFIFTFLVDKLISDTNLRAWYLNFILIFPLILPFLRFGLSLQYLSTKESENQNSILVVQYFIYSLLLLIYLLTNNQTIIILIFASIGAFFFNYGAKKIRDGNILGFFFQNGIVYSVLLLSVFFYDIFFSVIQYFFILIFILLTYRIYSFKFHINFTKKKIIYYFNDIAASFLIPFIFFVAFKVSSDLDVDDFLIVKITSFLSASVGSLILIEFRKMDNLKSVNEKLIFFKNKKHKLFLLLLLIITGASIFTISLYPDSIYLFFGLCVFEICVFYFGQYNLINIYFNLQKNIFLTSIFCSFIFLIIYILSKFLDFSKFSIFIYVLGITLFQLSSFITYKLNK